MNDTKLTKTPSIICLILLIGFPSAAAVLISPALPQIKSYFAISSGAVQQLITIFLLGYALGQLIYSPIANRFGRKVAIYVGVTLFLFGSILALVGIHAHIFSLIMLARCLMALGSAVGMTISFTIINDFYTPEEARSITSYTVLAYAFMPAVGVAIGGVITSHFSWIECFYVYVLYGLVILFAALRLPETLQPENKVAINVGKIFSNYLHAFGALRLLSFSFMFGLLGSFIYVIASAAPFIAIHDIGLSAASYGLLFLIPYSGQFIGAFSAGTLHKHFSAYQVLIFGIISVSLGTVMMFFCFLLHFVSVYTLIIPTVLIMIGLPMAYSTLTVLALVGFTDKATGSAAMSFITIALCLSSTYILTLLPVHNPITMPTVFVALTVLTILMFFFVRAKYPAIN